MEAEDLRPGVANFFISLPVTRDLLPAAFQKEVMQCYMQDYGHLLRIGVDERHVLCKIGIFNVQAYLENQMAIRYQDALRPTLQTLEHSAAELSVRLEKMEAAVLQNDPALLRQRASRFVSSLTNMIERLLQGSAVGDPELFGQTLQQERGAMQHLSPFWSALDLGFPIENAERKLYGGPQFHRLVNEFSWIAHAADLPQITIDEVASAMGTNKSHNFASYEGAVKEKKKRNFPLFFKEKNILFSRLLILFSSRPNMLSSLFWMVSCIVLCTLCLVFSMLLAAS